MKETFFSCLVPCSPPLTQLSTLQCGEAEQTAVQTPQIITQESHWERCVGSGGDSVCAPVGSDIHLHVSRPQPVKSRGRGFGFGLGGNKNMRCGRNPKNVLVLTTFIRADKILSPQTLLIHIPYQNISILQRARWSSAEWVKHTVQMIQFIQKKSQTANEHPQISNENNRLLYRLQLHFGISVWEYILQSKLNPLLNQPPPSNSILCSVEITSLTALPIPPYEGRDSLQSISESLIRWTLTLAMPR